jgi:molybdopterin-synthase adenylyltransferase
MATTAGTEALAGRYARQLRLPGFGPEAQERLAQASVLVSRVGGVGGTIAALLAQAGVGRLVLAHGGEILDEHLNRMQLATPRDVGRECSSVFAQRIGEINPEVDVVAVPSNVVAENAAALVGQADVVADGAPLFEERYLMNAEAVAQRRPLVMAAMFGADAYVTTIVPGETPCLACVFPERPPEWDHVGVFPAIGPSPRLAGSLAAMEVIKVITGYGRTLAGELLYADLESNVFRSFAIERRPDCPVCGAA